MIRISGLEVTGNRRTGEHAVRPYVRDFVGAVHGKARPNAQMPITTLETGGHLGEACLAPTVTVGIYSRGAHGFTR